MRIFNGKQAYFSFDSTGGPVKYIQDFRFLLRFPSNVTDENASGLWYYNVNSTWFGEDLIRSSAGYADVFKTKITASNTVIINANSYIVNINKRIKR